MQITNKPARPDSPSKHHQLVALTSFIAAIMGVGLLASPAWTQSTIPSHPTVVSSTSDTVVALYLPLVASGDKAAVTPSATATTPQLPPPNGTATPTQRATTTPTTAATSLSTAVSTPNAAPVINSFSVEPATIRSGESATLHWDVTGASKISISGLSDVTGNSITVTPSTTTEYTMIAANGVTSVVSKVTVTVNPSSPNGDTGAIWLPYDTEDNSVVNVSTTSMAVDPQGGIHGTYVIPFGGDAGHFPVYYVYCPAQCGDPTHWTRTRLSDNIQEARLQLDRQGRPRMMLYTSPSDRPDEIASHDYLYAECNGSCTDASHWTITTLMTIQDKQTFGDYLNNRWFALDPQGRPAFLYKDQSEGHAGTFYYACQVDCTNPNNWRDQFLNVNVIDYELAFTPTGEPRMLWIDVSDSINTVQLAYLECNLDCSQYSGTWLSERGNFGSYSLAIDTQARPRIAFYTGNHTSLLQLEAQRLYYLWCNAGCGNDDPRVWNMSMIGTSQGNGMTQQLVLDSADSPHIVYQMGDGGPGYLWCTANCTSATPTWAAKQIEDNSVLEQEFPNELNLRCSFQKWASGHRPSIALAASGNIVIGFDVSHSYYGNDVDHPDQPCSPSSGNLLSTDIQLSRVAILARP